MKTGNTSCPSSLPLAATDASMEPGHEDREYIRLPNQRNRKDFASMEPGHEDREYVNPSSVRDTPGRPQWSPVMKTGNTPSPSPSPKGPTSLNGARS